MNLLLTAVNAKYIHSNLAVYSLKAYAETYGSCYVDLAEYTINQPLDQILMDLYRRKPDVLGFSCYLWNISYVEQLVCELHKVLPETEIWLGGPEVSWNAEAVLERLPQVRGVMRGEGEETFLEVVRYYELKESCKNPMEFEVETQEEKGLTDILGITYRVGSEVFANGDRPVMKTLDSIPFVYHHIEDFAHKIIYYESSRGCPFSCSYCLSSIDKCLRFRSLDLVKKELQFFIDHKVPQVKFVDRTFNCKHDHAMAIWQYLVEHDQGITNFHFEVAADLLREEEIQLIQSMRPGLIQLEIGVQSTNKQTIREIRRTMKFEEVTQVVDAIHKNGNIHQHLDLIAGLPYEDYGCFRHSFNEVYALRPEQLQLGFLKVLKGSYMEEKAEDYGLVYQSRPPFEVLSTKWLSYEDVIALKGIEEMVEVHYNSRQFEHTMELLEQEFTDAFAMYEELRDYYKRKGLGLVNHTRISRYEILFDFILERLEKTGREEEREAYRESLTYDLYLRENVKNRPAFAGEPTVEKQVASAFYKKEEQSRSYLKGYQAFDKRQMQKMTHLERVDGKLILFDYQNRNPLTHQATTYQVNL